MTLSSRVVTGASALGLALLLGAGPTFAAADEPTGDWGFPIDSISMIAPGHKMVLSPALTCNPLPSVLPIPDTTPCHYTRDMRFAIRATNGAEFLNTERSELRLLVASTKTQIGTCAVQNNTEIVCSPSTAGTVGAGERLITDDSVIGRASIASCTPSFQTTWSNPSEEPMRPGSGNNDLYGSNDFHHIITAGMCG